MDWILPGLTDVVLKATILLGSGYLAVGLLHRSSSAVRHLVWVLTLGSALLIPLFGLASPWRWEVEALPPIEEVAGGEERAISGSSAPIVERTGFEVGDDLHRTAPASLAPTNVLSVGQLASLLITIWMVGVVVVLLRLVWGYWILAGIRQQARAFAHPVWESEAVAVAAKFGIAPVPLLESSEVEAPLALGLRTPLVLLPPSARGWTPERVRAVLLHEMAHVRRCDLVTHLFGRIACAIYWFHPLVWHAARRLRNESERACDDLALVAGAVPSTYAADLLEIARGALGHSDRNPALAMARPSEFEGRLLAILEPARARLPARRRVVAGATAAALGITLALAGLSVVPARASSSALQQKAPANPVAQKEPEVVANLIALLRDPSPRVRVSAADALGERRVASAIPEIAAALKDPSRRVRESAAYALGKINAEAPVAELTRLLTNDPDWDVRVAAIWALGESGSIEAVHALASAIEDFHSEELQERVVNALGETGQTAALPTLEGLLTRRDRDLREAALEAVAEIGTPEAEAVLIRAMQNPDARLRSMAAEALGGQR